VQHSRRDAETLAITCRNALAARRHEGRTRQDATQHALGQAVVERGVRRDALCRMEVFEIDSERDAGAPSNLGGHAKAAN
jgi:hypothetical protein